MEDFTQDNLAAAFAENRQRLFVLAEKRLNPILLKRMSAEDVLSETYIHAAKRLDYFVVLNVLWRSHYSSELYTSCSLNDYVIALFDLIFSW